MNDKNKLQNNFRAMIGSFAVGLYAWIVTVFFGAVLLDVVYSNLLGGFSETNEIAKVYSEVSDFLLRIGFITVLAALCAIGLSWKTVKARNYFIASLIILFGEILAPAFLSEAVLNSAYWLRLIINGVASITAIIGLSKYYRLR